MWRVIEFLFGALIFIWGIIFAAGVFNDDFVEPQDTSQIIAFICVIGGLVMITGALRGK
jgi:hypothetical protein